MSVNNVDFISKLIPESDDNEIRRCIKKATIIVRTSECILVADEDFIYYYCMTPKATKNKIGYKFYTEVKPLMEGKYLYSQNPTNYKNHITHIKGSLYLWRY